MLSPHQSDWLSAMEQKEQRLVRLLRDRLRTAQQHLDYLSTRLVHPRARLMRLDERLQMLGTRLRLAQFHVRDRMAHTRSRCTRACCDAIHRRSCANTSCATAICARISATPCADCWSAPRNGWHVRYRPSIP